MDSRELGNFSIIELFHLLKRDRLSFIDKEDQPIEVFPLFVVAVNLSS